MINTEEPEKVANLTVFYDGQCPICTREIGYYQGCDGGEDVDWVDITKVDAKEVHPGLSKERALKRFHVLLPNGELKEGAAGFAALWQSLKSFRLIGKVFSFAPLTWFLDRVYDVLLIMRPFLQRLFVGRG